MSKPIRGIIKKGKSRSPGIREILGMSGKEKNSKHQKARNSLSLGFQEISVGTTKSLEQSS